MAGPGIVQFSPGYNWKHLKYKLKHKNTNWTRINTQLILPETSSVPSVNISRVKEEICPVKLDILDKPPVKLLVNQEDIL